MSWPLISDFSRILQNPGVAFRDPTLRECQIEMDALGQPKARSGNFATVYRGYRPDATELAIRVFNRRADKRRERYRAVSDYLENRPLRSLVGFEYDEKGIRSASDGKFYPLLTMEWVPGVSLFDWTRDRCREGYQQALAIGAEVWLQLVRELAEGRIVHGDLQHTNVLVSSEGHFKLIDYDCLCVPELLNQHNPEIGMPPYQHPARTAETLMFPGLDNFSSLVIYVALRALAASPNLWLTYVDAAGYDKLLFRPEDFQNPAASPLCFELARSPDAKVRDLAHYLMELTRYPIQDVPPVDEVLLWCNSIEELLTARDWDKAVQLVQRMGAQEQIDPQLQPQIELARRRVAARRALQEALEGGDEARIQQCYVPQLLDDYPDAAPLVEQARAAPHVAQVLEVLKAAQRFQNWDVFQTTWQANQSLLNRRVSANSYQNEMKRLLTVDVVRRHLEDVNSDDQTVIEAWRHLQSLGGHPAAASLEPVVEARIARRRTLWKLRMLLEKAPEMPTVKHDEQIVAAWEPQLFSGWKKAGKLRPLFDAAQQRLQHLGSLHDLSETCTVAGEKEIVTMARQLPTTYHPALRGRAQKALERLRALHALRQAMQSPPSDLAILEAWENIEAMQAGQLLCEKERERAELAERRVPLIDALVKIDDDRPLHEREQKVLEIWDDSLLGECYDARYWQPIYELVRHRERVVEQAQQAMADGDVEAIETLAVDPALADSPLRAKMAKLLDDLKTKKEQAEHAMRQTLVNAMLENDAITFIELFDAHLVRQVCEKSPHHRSLMIGRIETTILPLSGCGLAAAAEPLEKTGENVYRAQWQWPPARICTRCRLAVCREGVKAHANPDDVDALCRATIERPGAEADAPSHELTVDPEWNGCRVVVWAEVDLGFEVLFSEPLDLGPLEEVPKPRHWRLFGRS